MNGPVTIRELISAGYLIDDPITIWGEDAYKKTYQVGPLGRDVGHIGFRITGNAKRQRVAPPGGGEE